VLTAEMIKALFAALNDELKSRDVIGEIGLCGGAVMCLVFNARDATKDVDAIFAPAEEIREAARRVARSFGVPESWLNDAAKGFFLSDPPRSTILAYSHLRVWAPTARYMLAMKCVSARFDTLDKDDVIFLIRHLELTKREEVFQIILKYYPEGRIPAKARFLIEELLPE